MFLRLVISKKEVKNIYTRAFSEQIILLFLSRHVQWLNQKRKKQNIHWILDSQ
jgi:hypothetical protein